MTGKPQNIELGNKPFATPYYSIGIEECKNFILEFAQSSNAKAKYYLVKIPGMRRLSSISATNLGGCRALYTTGTSRTFGVYGSTYVEIYADGTFAQIGTLSSYSGRVNMVDNGYQMIIVDGNAGYIHNLKDNLFDRIADESFPGNADGTTAPTHCAYLNTYFVVNNPSKNEYYWSNSYYKRLSDDQYYDYDPSQVNGYWTPLQTAQMYAVANNICALEQCNNYIWVFGDKSTEIHQDTGEYNGQQFARIDGAIINVGTSAKYSTAVYMTQIFWLGTDVKGTIGVYTNDGLAPKRISTFGIDQIIKSFDNYSDCIGFTYAMNGHAFYVMQFPSASRTFAYDLASDSWTERTYLSPSNHGGDGKEYAHKMIYATSNFDKLIAGHLNYSAVYCFDPQYYVDDLPDQAGFSSIRCAKTSPIGFVLGINMIYHSLQVICQQGVGLSSNLSDGTGVDPQVWMQYSDDSGESWTNQQSAPMGIQGRYDNRTMFRGLGPSRNRVWRIVMTDPVPFILVGLVAIASPCKF